MSLNVKRVCDRCGEEIPECDKYFHIEVSLLLNNLKRERGRYEVDPSRQENLDICGKCKNELNVFIYGVVEKE